MKTVTSGNTISVHYKGTFPDGTEFDSSYSRGEPITFQVGSGQMIAGFDEAVLGMKIGESKNVSLKPEQAYGLRDENAIQAVPREQFPEDMQLVEGHTIQGEAADGRQFMAKILEVAKEGAILDFNHPLAGRDLNFFVEVVEIS